MKKYRHQDVFYTGSEWFFKCNTCGCANFIDFKPKFNPEYDNATVTCNHCKITNEADCWIPA